MTTPSHINSLFTVTQLEKDYLELGSLKAVARKYGIDSSTVKRKMVEYGLSFKPQVRYSCDDDYFNQDTERSFYLAGFLAADGCVKDSKATSGNIRHELSIGLAKKDLCQVEFIKNELKTDAPIREFIVKNSKYNSLWKDSYKV